MGMAVEHRMGPGPAAVRQKLAGVMLDLLQMAVGQEEPHTIQRCQLDLHDVAHGSLRLSLSDYNTDEEMDHILKVVPEVVQLLRNMSPVWRDLQTGKREYIL